MEGGTIRQAALLHTSDSGAPVAFAGLYEHWEGTAGEGIDSCTIIVTQANSVMRSIHERMPVILKRNDFAAWLDPHDRQIEALKKLLLSWPEDDLDLYPVSNRVGNPSYDDPECIAAL